MTRLAVAAAGTVAALAGCSSDGDQASASCAAVVVFEGHQYLQLDGVPFTTGRSIGTAGFYDCNGVGASATQTGSGRDVLAVNGFPSDLVVAAEFKGEVWLFGRQDDAGRLVPEVARLVTTGPTPGAGPRS